MIENLYGRSPFTTLELENWGGVNPLFQEWADWLKEGWKELTPVQKRWVALLIVSGITLILSTPLTFPWEKKGLTFLTNKDDCSKAGEEICAVWVNSAVDLDYQKLSDPEEAWRPNLERGSCVNYALGFYYQAADRGSYDGLMIRVGYEKLGENGTHALLGLKSVKDGSVIVLDNGLFGMLTIDEDVSKFELGERLATEFLKRKRTKSQQVNEIAVRLLPKEFPGPQGLMEIEYETIWPSE